MSETKHTIGPWTLDPGKHRMWICRVGNNAHDPEIWSTYEPKIGESWPFGDKLADARLIAAAPDLLAALKATREWIERAPEDTWGTNAQGDPDVPGGYVSWPMRDELIHNIDTALAKAEARSTP